MDTEPVPSGHDAVGERLDEATVRAVFDRNEPLTAGIEEEVLLLDPTTLLPVPIADDIVAAAGEPASIKRELPACQVELATQVHADVAGAIRELRDLRARLLAVCGDDVRPAAAAVHPTAPAEAMTASGDRHVEIEHTYGIVARRQLVGALQVHVAIGSADVTLSVYNALRGYLPELAALAAGAPFHDGRDTGLASIRPIISGQLPRQGVPPAMTSWAELTDDLSWGRATGAVPEPRRWWWELRPHIQHGTLEVRVPDVQAPPEAMEAVASTVHALVADLSRRVSEGEPMPVPATWRIEENRWSALRDGVHGTLHDLWSGEPCATDRRLHALLDRIEPFAPVGLYHARRLVEHNVADDLRTAGISGAARWLTEAYRP